MYENVYRFVQPQVPFEGDQNRYDVNVNMEIKLESNYHQDTQIKEENSAPPSDWSLSGSRQSPDPKIKCEDGHVKPEPE